MSENIYEQLRANLDLHPFDCPPAPEIIEILKILFTEEEAKIALGLRFRPLSVREIAQNIGGDPQEVSRRLDSLAEKDMVFAKEENGVWKYALIHRVLLFEIPYKKRLHDETINKLTPLWKKYWPIMEASDQKISIAPFRIIPIQEEVEQNGEVLPYEKIYEMIDQAKVLGITHCACKEYEQNCDGPRETCMVFDETCTWMVESGLGRYLKKEEMKQKLKEFDEAGLVHQISNVKDQLPLICNCCPCCCGILRSMTEFGNPRAFTRSAFLPISDPELCVGCGICADERCPMKAIEMVDEKPILKIERCIGCGLCATGCPNGARRMERSAEVTEPPTNFMELGGQILQDQGKLEAFLEFDSSASKSSVDE